MRTKKISMNIITPVLVFLIITLVFTVITKGALLKPGNLKNLLDQVIPVLVSGCGMVFVIAEGGVDMTAGGIMGFSTAAAAMVYQMMGSTPGALVVMILMIIGIAGLIGFLNGVLVAVCKVNSFMTTLAISIILRGLMAYVINMYGTATVRPMRVLNRFPVKVAILIICLAACFYLLENHTFGRKCTAIGENELAMISSGVAVTKLKILAFVASGLMASVAAFLSMAKMGGSTASLGSNFELDVMFAMFVGGIAVTGGRTAHVINFVIGAFTVIIMDISFMLIGWSSGEMKQLIEGIILLILLFISGKTKGKSLKVGGKKDNLAAEAA